MDHKKNKRRQSLKTIFAEALMTLSVIITVAVLVFLVSGYWINSDFEIERQGLLQISSIPTGANIYIDHNSPLLQHTNTSKVLPSGEHTITLSKEGYDSWSKTINISEGLLYKIHYPRLFLENRKKETALDLDSITTATISPNHNSIILIKDISNWEYINLENEKLEPTKLSLDKIFSNSSSINTGILNIDWDHNNSHILLKIKKDNNIEWILIDIKNIDKSINLTSEFGENFEKIKIVDDSSNTLLAVQNNNLHKIDVPNKLISNILIKDIIDFDYYDNEIIFSAKNDSSENEKYDIGLFKLNDDKITKIKESSNSAKVTLSKFYDDKYITILKNNTLSIYKKNDLEKISNFELSFIPENIQVGHNGEFIIMYSGQQIATLDMESMSINEWNIENDSFSWIDNDMIYTVSNQDLIVYDYDGLNRRIISNNVSNTLPAAITNDKWLYYFNNDSNLMREWLIKH